MIKKVFRKVNKEDGVSIFWAISIVIGLSIALVAVSFAIFLNSGAYTTVKQITVATSTLKEDDLSGYDTTSPIRADILGDYMRSLEDKVKNIDDEEDFRQDILDKSDLGY